MKEFLCGTVNLASESVVPRRKLLPLFYLMDTLPSKCVLLPIDQCLFPPTLEKPLLAADEFTKRPTTGQLQETLGHSILNRISSPNPPVRQGSGSCAEEAERL